MVAVVSSSPSSAGGFGVQELHQTLEASVAMFSFVQCFAGGQCEFALFLVTVSVSLSVSLSLLESQMAVFYFKQKL